MINDNSISVWHAASSSQSPGTLESHCESLLMPAEVERAQRFRVATSRNQHVVGRGMARQLLAEGTCEPQLLEFEIEVGGKPQVISPTTAQRPFNVSHTDGLVLCGVGSRQHRLLGVDVEKMDRRTDPELAKRYFSPPEVQYLQSIDDLAKHRETFLRIWTLKESYIKAIGTGLRTPLADFAFEKIDSDQPELQLLNADLESDLHWKFFSIQPRPGFIAAVAVACEQPSDINVDLLPFESLVP